MYVSKSSLSLFTRDELVHAILFLICQLVRRALFLCTLCTTFNK